MDVQCDCSATPETPVCDDITGYCVECLVNVDRCPPGEYCTTSARCAPGCSEDLDCPDSSRPFCDVANHVCAECTESRPCPAGQSCQGGVCSQGCGPDGSCPQGLDCCATACVDLQSNLRHCGICNGECAIVGATAMCSRALCRVEECLFPQADCDRDGLTCETDLTRDSRHCGDCAMACPFGDHSTGTCSEGACGLACEPFFEDCDGNPANGCEADTRVDGAHCGNCSTRCTGTESCRSGTCGSSCGGTFADCNGDDSDMCEVDLSRDAAHCGMCRNACTPPTDATATCVNSRCGFQCNGGFGDCNGNSPDGCEVNTGDDPNHCGRCNGVCSSNHGVPDCSSGVCTITCDPGFGDCDGMIGNGCETQLTSTSHCGSCGRVCTTGMCVSGMCLCYDPMSGDLGNRLGRVTSGSTTGRPSSMTPVCGTATASDIALRWTAPADGTYTFDTVGSGYDTVLDILSGCSGTSLGCNDDFNGSANNYASAVTVVLSVGQSIIVLVDGFSGASGNFVINVSEGFVPNACVSASSIAAAGGHWAGSCAAYCVSRGLTCSNTCTTNRGGSGRYGVEAWYDTAGCQGYSTSGGQENCATPLIPYGNADLLKYRCCCRGPAF